MGAARAQIILRADRPSRPVHIRGGRGQAAEPVIGVGDAGSGIRAEPGVSLKPPDVVAVEDAVARRVARGGWHGLDPEAVEIVVLVEDRRVVALPQGRAVAGIVIAIFLVIALV